MEANVLNQNNDISKMAEVKTESVIELSDSDGENYVKNMSFDERLSETVRKYTLLYDKACEEFHSREAKQKAWDDVARELGVSTGKEAERQFKLIRDRYQRAKNAIKDRTAMSTTSAIKLESKFDSLNFLGWLDEYIKPRMRLAGIKNKKRKLHASFDVVQSTMVQGMNPVGSHTNDSATHNLATMEFVPCTVPNPLIRANEQLQANGQLQGNGEVQAHGRLITTGQIETHGNGQVHAMDKLGNGQVHVSGQTQAVGLSQGNGPLQANGQLMANTPSSAMRLPQRTTPINTHIKAAVPSIIPSRPVRIKEPLRQPESTEEKSNSQQYQRDGSSRDSAAIFGDFVADQLRQLSREQAVEARFKISEIFYSLMQQ